MLMRTEHKDLFLEDDEEDSDYEFEESEDDSDEFDSSEEDGQGSEDDSEVRDLERDIAALST